MSMTSIEPGDAVRRPLLQARRIVIKVGSSLLTGRAGAGGEGGPPVIDGRSGLHLPFLQRLAQQITALRASGREVALVTSGAVAAGVATLGIERPREIPRKQAAAAVGQSKLMHAYEEVFGVGDVQIAQVLITHEDLAHRGRFLNARDTLRALLEWRVLPIFNENDTVAVAEIKVGDNDNLSSLVASMIEADLLILLSDVAGLYDADPRSVPTAARIPVVRRIDAAVRKLAGGAGTRAGTGGMITKIEAAERAAASGIPTVIAAGTEPAILQDIVAGRDVGTLFLPKAGRLGARKHWIAFTLKPAGRLLLDAGAARAIAEGKKSLLPRGVRSVEGRFGRGACVRLCDEGGREIARGLVAYGADDVRRLCGAQSRQIESILGYTQGDEIVHRDDLVDMSALQGEAA